MPPVVVLLLKNAGVGFVRGVGGETDRFTRLKRPDVDVVADIGKNAVEGRLMFGSPLPRLVFLGEVGETGRGIGVMGYELVIEPNHAKEGTEVGKTARRRKVPYTLDFIGSHPDAFTTNDVETEEVAFLCEPLTLVGLETEAVVPEGLENEADVFLVLLERALGVDDNVIEVGVAEDAKIGVEDRIDEPLEDRGGGGESHGHDGVLEGAEEGFESSGFLRAGGHAEIGETGTDVHSSDPIGASEVVHEGTGEGNGVLIEHDLAVEVPVVDDEAKLARTATGGGVAYEEHRGRGFRLGGFDETALDLKIEEGFELFKLFLRHVVELACLELGPFSELNGTVVVWSVWRKLIGGLVGEDGVSEVAEFLWNGVKPSFLVACESSDSWIIGSCDGGSSDLGDVVVVFDGEVDLGSDAKAGDVLLVEFLSAVFLGLDGC